MNILIFGQVCIDKNSSENTSYIAAGSPAMFINKIYSKFPDCEVTIIASYGPDFLKYLKGVSIYPKKPNSKKTLVYENITKDGFRIQKAHHRDEALPVPINQEIENLISEADLIFIAPILPNFPADYLKNVHSLKSKEAQIVLLPQGYCRAFNFENMALAKNFAEADQILPLVDILIVSETDSRHMLQDAKNWAQKHGIICVVTQGERGAVAFSRDQKVVLPARALDEAKIVDSVGSGDVFSAGFAYRYKQTKDIKEAGRFANELARQRLFYKANQIKIDFKAQF